MRIRFNPVFRHSIYFKPADQNAGKSPSPGSDLSQLKNEIVNELRARHIHADKRIDTLERAFNLMIGYYSGKEGDANKTAIHLLQVAKTLAVWGADPLVVSAGLLHLIPAEELSREKIDAQVIGLIKRKQSLGAYLFVPLMAKLSERGANYLFKMCLMQEGSREVWLLEAADEFISLASGAHTDTRASRAYHVTSRILSLFDLDSASVKLEDIALLRLDKEEYDRVEAIITDTNKRSRLDALSQLRTLTELISEDLSRRGIRHRVEIDVKSVPRSLKKMRKGERLTDSSRFRVIIDAPREECVTVMEIIAEDMPHLGYYENMAERRNFLHGISIPHSHNHGRKENGYESVHLHFWGEKYEPVNVQVRTEEMHRVAEAGSASHGRFKLDGFLDAQAVDEASLIRERLVRGGERYGIHRGKIYRLVPFPGKRATLLDLAFADSVDLGLHSPEEIELRRIDPSTGEQKKLSLKFSSPLENGDIIIVKRGAPVFRNPRLVSTASASTALKLAPRGLDRDRIQQRTSEAVKEGEVTIKTELSSWFNVLNDSIRTALERNGIITDKAKIFVANSLKLLASTCFGLENENELFAFVGLAGNRKQIMEKVVRSIRDTSAISAYVMEEQHATLLMMVRSVPGILPAIFRLINEQKLGIDSFSVEPATTYYSLVKLKVRSRKSDFESEMQRILAGSRNIYDKIRPASEGVKNRKIEVRLVLNRCNAYLAEKITGLLAKNGANIVSGRLEKNRSKANIGCCFTVSVPVDSADAYMRNFEKKLEALKRSVNWLRASAPLFEKL